MANNKEKKIQNNKNNETKFVLIGKEFNHDSSGKISSLIIAPRKDRPGLLFDILKSFKDNDLNLIKIESRPSKSKLGTYIFYIDIDGNHKDEAVKRAVSGIRGESEVYILGSYNREKFQD
jgi:prephenate dehydratase